MAGPGGDLVWSPARPGVAARVVSFTVIGLLAVGLGITVAVTRGVSEEEGANGAVGVTVNVTGDAVLLLRVCTGRADTADPSPARSTAAAHADARLGRADPGPGAALPVRSARSRRHQTMKPRFPLCSSSEAGVMTSNGSARSRGAAPNGVL